MTRAVSLAAEPTCPQGAAAPVRFVVLGPQHRSPDRRGQSRVGAYVVWALLLAAVLPWRAGVYFDGGLDSVVMAKAVLSVVALAVSLLLARRASRRTVVAAPLVAIVGYLAATLVGGLIQAALLPSLVLAGRVLLLTGVIACLVVRYSAMGAMRALVHLLGTVAVLAALTGYAEMVDGRLAGAIPPMHPNELALLSAVCALWLFAKVLHGRDSAVDLVMLALFLGIVFLTGSRTTLGTLVLVMAVLLVRLRALSLRSFSIVVLAIPAAAYILMATNLVSGLLSRGASAGSQTLSNRTVAWRAAISLDRGLLQQLFGGGLAQKRVEVRGQWWTSQILDSSWISALVQGGLIGLGIVLILVLRIVWRAVRTRGQAGALWLGLILFLAARGFLESALFDASVSFLVLMVVAWGALGDAERPDRSP